MAHQDDWDRGFEAGKAQGVVDAHAKMRTLEEQVEKAKRTNSRSRIKAQLSRATAEIAGLKLVVEAAGSMRALFSPGNRREVPAVAAFDATMAKLKETTG